MSKYIILDSDEEHTSIITSAVKKIDPQPKFYSAKLGSQLNELIAVEKADFLFISAELPDQDGSGMCKMIKNKYPGHYRIILTANSEEQQKFQQSILNSGADAFFSFPLNELTFRLQLQSWFSSNKSNLSKTANNSRPQMGTAEFDETPSEREEKYSAIIENSTDGILIINEDGLIIEANKSIERITGLSKKECTNVPFWDFQFNLTRSTAQNEETYDLQKEYLLQILKERESHFFRKLAEQEIKRMDGQIRYIETTFYPIHTSGKFYVANLVRDITQRKLFEEAIKNSESKYHGIFDANKDGISIFFINPDNTVSNFIEANKAAFEMIGYSKEEFLSMNIFDLEPDLTPVSVSKIMNKLKKKNFLNRETTINHKNKSRLNVDIHTVTIRYNNGVAIMNIVRDITARKKVESDLQESEKLYRNLVGRMPDGVYKSTHFGKFVEVNPAMVKMLGYNSKEELLAIDIKNDLYFHPDDRESISLMEKYEEMGIFRLRKKDGSEIWVEDHGWYILDEKGEILFHEGIMRDITERYRASKAIADERILLRTLIDNIPDMIYVKDTSGRKLISNKADLALLGLSDEKYVIGKTDMELFGGEFASRTFEDDLTVIRTAKPIYNKPETYTGSDGVKRILSITKIPLTSESGEITGLIGVGRDITREKENEKKIIQLSKAIEQSPASIIITDTQGNIEYLNQRVIDITGYSLQEIKGKNPSMFQSGYTSQEEYAKLWRTIRSGEEYRGEIQNRKRDGEVYWESVVISAIRNDEGEIVNFLAIKEDITNRKKSDLEIMKLSVGIEQNPASVAITDTRGIIEYVNKKFVALSGYSAKELTGKVLRILKPGHVDDETYIDIWNCLFAGNEWRGEHQNRNKKHEKYWESVLISPIKNQEGKITNYIVLSEDISERKKMESDLIHAKEKAVESDRLKSAFLANMSHEIRTPLNSILGFSDLLSDPNLDAGTRTEFVNLINSSGNNLLAIINDVLDISKIEAGQVTLTEKEFSANDLVTEIRKEYFHKAAGKGVEFRLRLPEKEPHQIRLISDEVRIKQVLINFVGNALKFTESGFIEIGVERQNKKIQFHVKDTGIGIAKEYHEKIFDRFRQVEGANTRKYSGNGLGLAITKNLAVLLGGNIWIESEPGEGSTFYFSLPSTD